MKEQNEQAASNIKDSFVQNQSSKVTDSTASLKPASNPVQIPPNPLDDVLPSLSNVFTGADHPKRHLIHALKDAFQKAQSIDLAVSFLMESGVRMMLPALEEAHGRGIPIRILCGSYLNITQPSALLLLKSRLPNADLRFYAHASRSFHPKAYLFTMKEGRQMLIGSSNFSKSALTSGIEWNYRITDQSDSASIDLFQQEFEDLFNHHAIVLDQDRLSLYSSQWKQPKVYLDLEHQQSFASLLPPSPAEKSDGKDQEQESVQTRPSGSSPSLDGAGPASHTPDGISTGKKDVSSSQIQNLPAQKQSSLPVEEDSVVPRGPQIEALLALEQTRKEGARRALVQAATGVGKTYLAAFDSREFDRVLFVAHRHEILIQAAESFAKVRPHDSIGFFEADQKDTNQDLIFASVFTLGKKDYLQSSFSPEDFTYIVIDEFHHAAAGSYQNILEYFQPKFLLGLTATPERMDGRNIYEICDYNVPFQMDLQKAINQGVLAPFHYYGIYDATDYTNIEYKQGRYLSQALFKAYKNSPERNELIFKHFLKHKGKRALGFCSSVDHAMLMAQEFLSRGIKAAVLISQNRSEDICLERREALSKLKQAEIDVLFCVDMLNEGVDIPAIDLVMFLRPTESSIVFLQQLGRGLRKAPGKEYLTVLDFIGNYKNAGKVPRLLSGSANNAPSSQPYQEASLILPEGCFADFDIRLLDLFDHLRKSQLKKGERIFQEYKSIADLLGHVPSRMDLFTYMSEDIYNECFKSSSDNPMKNYLEYRHQHQDLSEDLEYLYNSRAREFLHLLETTSMSKVYKMPVLMSFLHQGKVQQKLTQKELLQRWKSFFSQAGNWRDLPKVDSYEDYLEISDKKHWTNIQSNPVRFLLKSGEGFFLQEEGYPLMLHPDLIPFLDLPAFFAEMEDILKFRQMDYYRRRYKNKEKERSKSPNLLLAS